MPAITSLNQHNKKSRSTKPKLFQCTGFGSCHMVFTRSEHLARHTRKHTGEKPFHCVVPGCTRKFSRFDNMMQHTQTHKTSRGKSTFSTLSMSSPSPLYEPENTPDYNKQVDSSDEESSVITTTTTTSSSSTTTTTSEPLLKELHLTQDEFEALQGFGRFKHTPIFIDSFRDLASVVYIEPNPVRHYM